MKKLLYSAMALIVLGGCSEDQDLVSVMRGKEVRLCSSIATRTVGDQWESGKEIGVYMTSPDGDQWVSGDAIGLYISSDSTYIGENAKYATTGSGDFAPFFVAEDVTPNRKKC